MQIFTNFVISGENELRIELQKMLTDHTTCLLISVFFNRNKPHMLFLYTN